MTDWCCAVVPEPPHYTRSHTCYRPAKGHRDGFPACGIHLRANTTVTFDDGETRRVVRRSDDGESDATE